MSVGLRCRHDRSVRELAAGMFGEGRGYESVARSLGIPAKAVRKWQQTYRAVGRDGLPDTGKTHARYDYVTKVAAARAVAGGGMSKPGAMERFGIASSSPLDRWCRLYREGGAEALRPKPKGRPRGSGAKGAPRTREQELEERVRKLEAQVAMELRAVDGARIADKTVPRMMNEMGLRCGIRRETDHHRHASYRGKVGETFENVLGRDFAADGPWQKMGTDVTEFKCGFGKAYLAPVYDFGSKEIVAWSVSEHPDLAQQEEMLAMLMAAKPEGAAPVLHSDMGWQDQHASYVAKLRENGFVQSMSRKGNCIDNGATEQVFGHLKDEFYRGRDWETFEEFKRDLEAYIHHWNHARRQARLKGLTPVEFRDQALRGAA